MIDRLRRLRRNLGTGRRIGRQIGRTVCSLTTDLRSVRHLHRHDLWNDRCQLRRNDRHQHLPRVRHQLIGLPTGL